MAQKFYRGKAVRALGAILASVPDEEVAWEIGQAVGLLPYMGFESEQMDDRNRKPKVRKPVLVGTPDEEPVIELDKSKIV